MGITLHQLSINHPSSTILTLLIFLVLKFKDQSQAMQLKISATNGRCSSKSYSLWVWVVATKMDKWWVMQGIHKFKSKIVQLGCHSSQTQWEAKDCLLRRKKLSKNAYVELDRRIMIIHFLQLRMKIQSRGCLCNTN